LNVDANDWSETIRVELPIELEGSTPSAARIGGAEIRLAEHVVANPTSDTEPSDSCL